MDPDICAKGGSMHPEKLIKKRIARESTGRFLPFDAR